MSRTNVPYPDVLDHLGLTHCLSRLLEDVPPLAPVSPLLIDVPLATQAHTELARSAWLVGPVLAEVWRRYAGRVGMYAGEVFGGPPSPGVEEPCEFIVCRSPQQMGVLAPPVRLVVTVGKGGPVSSLGQCIATAVTAQRYNHVAGRDGDEVFGCGTCGIQWRFFRLTGSHLTFDIPEYTIAQVDRILGILTHIIGPVPAAAA